MISKRAEALFLQAQTMAPETRAQFIDDSCGNDNSLRDEVHSLLDAANESEAFFESLAGEVGLAALAENDSPLPAGKTIGHWRLVKLIGRGGMGSVYLAERADGQFTQQAALKILPFGLDSEEARARFRNERQILARLQHDHIARLLDGGVTDDGMPYFVMDYVDGLPIDEYCDKHDLDVEQRIELVLDVADAVRYAHRNLIVHRDLKPGNVLVESGGRARLLDFGIAKSLYTEAAAARLTRTGMSPMTALYASPEMLRNEPITTAADVYALGILLYELLARRHPYRLPENTSPPDIWRHVVEVDPTAPGKAVLIPTEGHTLAPRQRRQISRRLRGDLDTIVLKAMHKDPEHRYASVELLATDLRRFLEGRPILARPPTLRYRFRKFVVRRKELVAAAAAALVFLVTVLFQAQQTARESERANREAYLAQQVSEFLVSLFEFADPAQARGTDVTAREILDEGAAGLTDESIADPEVRSRLLSTIGQVYESLAVYDEAERLYREAVETQVAVGGERDPQTLNSQRNLASAYMRQGRFQEARDLLTEVVAHQRSTRGDTHPDTMNSINNLAIAHAQLGDFAMAAELLGQVAAYRRSELGLEAQDTLSSIQNLAIFMKLQGRVGAAESLFLEILEPQKRVAGIDHPITIGLMQNLADLYSEQGRYTEAEPIYAEAIVLFRRVFGEGHPYTARIRSNFANMYKMMGRLDEAEPLYVESLGVIRELLGDTHVEALRAGVNLAELHVMQSRFSDAEKLLRQVEEAGRNTLGEGHAVTLKAQSQLIDVYRATDRNDAARELTVQVLEQRRIRASAPDASPEEKLMFASNLLTCEPADLRDPPTALEFANAANAATGAKDPRFLRVLALAYHQNGDGSKAVETQEQALGVLPETAVDVREEMVAELNEYAGTP